MPDDLGGRKKHVRALLRTIGRLLDEASTPSIHADRTSSDECSNRALRAVLDALDTTADYRAFDINAEVRELITPENFETDALTRKRLRHLRSVGFGAARVVLPDAPKLAVQCYARKWQVLCVLCYQCELEDGEHDGNDA